jgi:Ca2+-transporting ATPase
VHVVGDGPAWADERANPVPAGAGLAGVGAAGGPVAAAVAEVAGSLDVDPAAGLSPAEVAERLASAGRNRLAPAAQIPAWRKLLAQFADPLIYLLLAAIVISVLPGRWKAPRECRSRPS